MSSPTEPTKQTTIEDLPVEMISELFKHLPPTDLAACSMVNKSWHSVYAAFKVDSLVATASPYRHWFQWYHSGRIVRQEELCYLYFGRLADQSLFSNLKHLALFTDFFHSAKKNTFDLNRLNRFSQLVQLEIDGCLGKKAVKLNLSELRVLAFHRVNDRCSLSIDCPVLSVLLYRGEPKAKRLLKVKQAETVKKLETDMFGPKLKPFKCIECLVTKTMSAINEATLQLLPELKELRCNETIMELQKEFDQHSCSTEALKSQLGQFLETLEELGRSNFQFIVSGLQIDEEMLYEEIDFFWPKKPDWVKMSDEYFYIKNLHLIGPNETLDFVEQLNYTTLLENQVGMAPKSFFRKFTGAKEVNAEGTVEYPSHFLCFLESLSSLKLLDLRHTELGQDLYDQLPASAPRLVQLNLYECVAGCKDVKKCACELKLNFDFIGKLPHMGCIYILQGITFESMTSLIQWVDKLKVVEFEFIVKAERFIVEKKEDSEEFEVLSGELLKLKTKNPVEIVKFFEDLQAGAPEAKKPRNV